MTDDDRMNELRALAHPVRLQILSLLTGADLSAAEVARELGLTHANASYHLRTLHAAGELTVTGEERIRGGVAKRYRHEWRSSPSAAPSTGRTRSKDATAFVRAAADELVRRYAARATGRRPADPRSPTRSSGWSPRPTSGPRPARGGQPPAARRRPAAAHEGHDARQPDRRDVPDGRRMSTATTDAGPTPSRPCGGRRSGGTSPRGWSTCSARRWPPSRWPSRCSTCRTRPAPWGGSWPRRASRSSCSSWSAA